MGDKFSPQTQSGDLFTHQGFVELDDAVVENAADAIRLWNPYDYNSSGGVVQATRTDFINNARSVEFIDYQNFYVAPNGKVVLVGNASKFDLCQFMTTPDYDAVGHSGLPIPHVTMWRVGNIPYKGCTFNNTHGSLGLGGIGISALDAQFTVTEFVHGGGTTYSGFDGLRYGIRSLYVNSPSTYLVHEAKFSNNLIGIYNSGVDNPRVTHCSFNVGFVASDPRPNYGIYLNGGTGYIIEENTFNGNAGSSTQSIGIVARETGNELNVIYKNNFNDMTYANLSNGDNTGGSTPEADAFGLKYECNVNDLSAYDFAVPLENLLPFGVSGVQSGPEEQGTPLAAGNNFTDVASGALVSQFFNLGLPLTYHADVNIPEEVPTATIGISSIDPAPNNSCESHLFTVRDTRLTESEREIVEQEFNTKIQGLNSLSQNLNALIDDGDTQGLINTINNATSSNAAQVKNQLLAISPYLGQPVLMATADQSPAPFSHNDLYKICKANPDELKPTLLDYMDSKTNPLPGNLIDSLQNYIGQTTPRSDTLAAMSGYAVAAYNAANLLINDLLLDSTNYDMTRLRNWWTSKATLAADYTLIDSYIQEQDTSKAKQVSNSLPSKYNLTGAILTDYNNHLLLREIEIELISEGRNWNNLTNDEINILINIAEDDIGRTGKCAQNVLSFYYGFDYFREAILPAPPPQSMTLPDQTIAPGKDQKEIVQWLAYPNPATNEVFIEYSLPNDVKNPVLLISDANGKVVLQQGLDIKLDKFIWNTSDHKDGMYFYTLRFNDQMQQTKQLLLMK